VAVTVEELAEKAVGLVMDAVRPLPASDALDILSNVGDEISERLQLEIDALEESAGTDDDDDEEDDDEDDDDDWDYEDDDE
jgi:hypothetical protein